MGKRRQKIGKNKARVWWRGLSHGAKLIMGGFFVILSPIPLTIIFGLLSSLLTWNFGNFISLLDAIPWFMVGSAFIGIPIIVAGFISWFVSGISQK